MAYPEKEVFKVVGGGAFWEYALTLEQCDFRPDSVMDFWLVYFYTSVTANIEFEMQFFWEGNEVISFPLNYFATGVRLLPDAANPGMNPRASLNGQIVSPMAIRVAADRMKIRLVRGTPVNVYAAALCS